MTVEVRLLLGLERRYAVGAVAIGNRCIPMALAIVAKVRGVLRSRAGAVAIVARVEAPVGVVVASVDSMSEPLVVPRID